MKTFNVNPIGKPRMTQRDRWKKRDCVLRYFDYKDQINLQKGSFEVPEAGSHIVFYIPMPKSWSNKKKREYHLKRHQQRPDVDNLAKAFFDALLEEDSAIWDCRLSKVWTNEPGKIVVKRIEKEDN